MTTREHRILTSHVGSLIRPQTLVSYLKEIEAERPIDQSAYQKCLDESIEEVVTRQVETGIDIINDGEFGKLWGWASYIGDRLSGVELRPLKPGESYTSPVHGKDRHDFAAFYAEYDGANPTFRKAKSLSSQWTVTGPIRYIGQDVIRLDIEHLKKATKGVAVEGVFMPAVSPSSVMVGRKDDYYGSDVDFLDAIADALHEEYKAIVDAGFILQIDDSFFATYYDMIVPPGTVEDYRRWASIRVDAINRALKGLPEERTRFHVCWGSWNSPHSNDAEFRHMADLVLKIRTGGYSIEMANARHEHEWRVWESVKLPAGKVLLPGVVSHQTNVVEHPDLVAERIVRLARLVGRENVIGSTDCGFAQGPFYQRVHPTIQWAKLRSLAEGARLASKELWSSRRAA
jgi:5-methyltetrahydropteroyltriglutamate--homocysteine methyltransferase